MRKLCIINRKGGVGKTTTAVNVASKLAMWGRKVLLVDLDPQGNIGQSLHHTYNHTIYSLFTSKQPLHSCIHQLGKNLDIIPSDETLTKIEANLNNNMKEGKLLHSALSEISEYDYILFDCAPSLNLINQNAMLFCDEAILPVSTQHLSLQALTTMIEAIDHVNTHYDHDLQPSYIVPTLHDKRNKSNKTVHKKIRDLYGDKVTAPIRINARLSEAPNAGKSIFTYDSSSRGAKDYEVLARQILDDEKRFDKAKEPISLRVQRMMADVDVD
ncbi:MAG: ParA family protein [Nanobdellota archaeon]